MELKPMSNYELHFEFVLYSFTILPGIEMALICICEDNYCYVMLCFLRRDFPGVDEEFMKKAELNIQLQHLYFFGNTSVACFSTDGVLLFKLEKLVICVTPYLSN